MPGLLSHVKALEPRVRLAWGAALVGLLAFLILIVLRLTSPVMVPLYANLGFEQSRPIIERLQALEIPYEVRANGATVLVPENQVATLQLSLAGLIARSASGSAAAAGGPRDLGARRSAHEDQLRRQIESVLSEIVGFDNVRASVAVELNFSRTTTNTESFDRNSQIERSTTLVEEFPPNQSGRPNPIRSEQKTDYEIGKTTRTETIEPGEIRKLSAVILIDGTYGPDANGDIVYQPRTQAELDQWSALVSSAIGFDAARGDILETVNIQFASPSEQELGTSTFPLLGLSRQALQNLMELILLAGAVVFVLVIFARHLSEGRLPGFRKVVTETGPMTAVGVSEDRVAAATPAGRQGGASVGQVGRIVEQNPEETAAIIRKWLNSE
jgi:flagellar M-ring protein FliF